MERYVFSGSLTDEMHDILAGMPEFKPFDILVSQLDRSAIRKTIKWKHEGFCRWLFIDSGAFSVHTGKANVTADEYIDYINSIDEDVDVCAQLDTIPGHFGQGNKFTADNITFTKDYIQKFIEVEQSSQTSAEIMRKMKAAYPDLAEGSLEMSAKVVEAQAEVPRAMAIALKEGRIGVMDYFNMNNITADTKMREAIGQINPLEDGK